MAFDATTGSQHTIRLDATAEVGGQDEGPRPMEMLLVSLGGCTGMDVISILKRMRQVVTGYEVNVNAERAVEHPKIFTKIVVEHVVRGRNLSEGAVRKAVDLSERKYCPASAMLGKAAKIEHRYRVIQDDEVLSSDAAHA